MPFLMGSAQASWVLAEEIFVVEPALAFIEQWNAEHDATEKISLHTLLLRACAKTLERHPRLNRFVLGNRYYQRDGIYLAFSAKKEFSAEGGLLVLKRRFDPAESLAAMAADLRSRLTEDRTTARTGQEREEQAFLKLPGPLLSLAIAVLRRLDDWNLLPASFIEHDVFHASLFVANLGSLGMPSGYHHLYNLGTIPVFIVMGAPRDAPWAEDGQVTVRKVVSLKFTFDERIEDGFNAGKAVRTLSELLQNPASLV